MWSSTTGKGKARFSPSVWEGGPSGWEEDEGGSYDHSCQKYHLFPFLPFPSNLHVDDNTASRQIRQGLLNLFLADSFSYFMFVSNGSQCLSLTATEMLLVTTTKHNVLHATSLWWVPLSPFQPYWSSCGPKILKHPSSSLICPEEPFLDQDGNNNNNNTSALMLMQPFSRRAAAGTRMGFWRK